MSEEQLMTGLLVVLFSGIFIFVCVQRLKSFLPVSALESFGSVVEIKAYYQSAVTIIFKKRWLMLLPLAVTLSAYLIKIPFFLHQRSQFASLSNEIIALFAEDFINRTSLLDIIKTLTLTPGLLDYGYHGSISGSIIFLGFFLIYCATFKAETRRLRSYSDEYNFQNVSFFQGILKYSFIFLVAAVSVSAAIFFASEQTFESLFFIITTPLITVIGIASLSLFSLVEGFVLFSVKSAIFEEEHDFKTLLNGSLTILKPLFSINILLAVVSCLPSAVLYPITLNSIFDLGIAQSPVSQILLGSSSFFTYINAFLTSVVFCAPFVLILMPVTAYEAFKINFMFIRNNFLKYFIFVGIGTVMLFLPSLLHDILKIYTGPLDLTSVIIEILAVAIRICIAVIFYIAMFTFFIDARSKSTLNDETARKFQGHTNSE